ncbi:MAG: hypothetical protein JSS49_05205 [Planctomycetes bacterium]|nr:hypothetical protein [Planctomycetota bacterium]
MLELLKQTVYASVGLASLARDRVSEIIEEVARRAKLSEAEAAELQKDVADRVEKSRHELGAEIDRRIDQAFIQAGILKAGVKHSAEAAGSAVLASIEQNADAICEQLSLARTEEIVALTKRVELLEQKLAAMSSS